MANPDHVAILEQGVETWNQWRDENPEIKPDLSDIYLGPLEVSPDADPHSAINPIADGLDVRDLRGINLSNAYLADSSLAWAVLENARLDGANLIRSDMHMASLDGANLTHTNIRDATNLTCEQLTKANHWELACRRDEHACGASIPKYPGDTVIELSTAEMSITGGQIEVVEESNTSLTSASFGMTAHPIEISVGSNGNEDGGAVARDTPDLPSDHEQSSESERKELDRNEQIVSVGLATERDTAGPVTAVKSPADTYGEDTDSADGAPISAKGTDIDDQPPDAGDGNSGVGNISIGPVQISGSDTLTGSGETQADDATAEGQGEVRRTPPRLSEAPRRPYELVVEEGDRPTIVLRPTHPPQVSQKEKDEAANRLAVDVRRFAVEVRATAGRVGGGEGPPPIGHNQRPVFPMELLDQIDADAETVIAQANAPAPDLVAIERFKSMLETFVDFCKLK